MGGREGPAADDGTYVDTWRAELLLSSEIHFVFFPVCVWETRLGGIEAEKWEKTPNDKAGQLKSFFSMPKSVSVSGRDGIGIEV